MTVAPRNSSKAIVPAMRYRDLDAAVGWLCLAFGFEVHRVVRDKKGLLDYAELSFGNSMLMLGSTRNQDVDGLMAQPDQVGGAETQSCYLLVDDVDTLHARATKAGATIVFDGNDDDSGGRSFGCKDIEGHIWFFGSSAPQRVTQHTPNPSQRKIASRVFATLALGSLAIALGLSAWLFIGVDDGPDKPFAVAINNPSDDLRSILSRESAARQTADEEASRLAKLLEEKRHALEQRSLVIERTKQKLAAEEKKRREAELAIQEALATVERERADREALATMARRNAETVARLKHEFEKANAALASQSKQHEQNLLATQEKTKLAIKQAEQLLIEERKAREAAELKAARSTQDALATIERKRADRETLATLAQRNADSVAGLKRQVDEANAALASQSKQHEQDFLANQEKTKQAIKQVERLLVQERKAREAAQLKAAQTARSLQEQKAVLKLTTEVVRRTRQQLTAEQNKRKAAESSIKKLVAALAKSTESRIVPQSLRPLPQNDEDIGLGVGNPDTDNDLIAIIPPLPGKAPAKSSNTLAKGRLRQTDHDGNAAIERKAAPKRRRVRPRSVAQRRAPELNEFRLRRRVP
ncbi:MAG: VOC family protein [Hyphomicrobiaceae bacterium]